MKAARRELLLALDADPDHEEALRYLKRRLEPRVDLYVFKEGDTLENLAERVYGNPSYAALLRRLNSIEASSQPGAGRPLALPLLEREQLEKTAEHPAEDGKKDGDSEEAEAQAQAICMQTKDFGRAFEAFANKRRPEIEGDRGLLVYNRLC